VDKTLTQPTGRTSEPDLARPSTPLLTLLLECDRPVGGSELISLASVDSVSIGRGEARAVRVSEARGGGR
jgi:hypothetical protein